MPTSHEDILGPPVISHSLHCSDFQMYCTLGLSTSCPKILGITLFQSCQHSCSCPLKVLLLCTTWESLHNFVSTSLLVQLFYMITPGMFEITDNHKWCHKQSHPNIHSILAIPYNAPTAKGCCHSISTENCSA